MEFYQAENGIIYVMLNDYINTSAMHGFRAKPKPKPKRAMVVAVNDG